MLMPIDFQSKVLKGSRSINDTSYDIVVASI